ITIGALVTLYSLLGGIEAVIWTDMVQTVIMVVGLMLCIALIFVRYPTDAEPLFKVANDAGKWSLGSYEWSFTTSTFWLMLFYGLCINLQNFSIDQNYVQRYASADSDRSAKGSVWLGA